MTDSATSITGILGGSFNPVHNGHLTVATHILRSANLSDVWLMVSPLNPLKRRDGLADDGIRVDMARAAVEGINGLSVSTLEMSMPRPSYTWMTMRALTDRYPKRRFALLIGADNWMCFNQWRKADELMSKYSIIVYPRKGYDVDIASMPPGVSYCDMPTIDISSTDIRRRVHTGMPISDLVPPAVEQIIRSRHLYI